MDQCLIQVEYKRFPATMFWLLAFNDCKLRWHRVLAKTTGFLELIELLLGEVQLLFEVLLVGLGCDTGLLLLLWHGLVLLWWVGWLHVLFARTDVLPCT